MNFSHKTALLVGLCLCMTAGAGAQMMHRSPHTPQMPTPLNPVVGSGAEYAVTTQQGTLNFSYAVVGKETVDGNEGYWLEIRTQSPRRSGEMIMKELTVLNGPHSAIKRLIMQPPGRPAMEMPANMMSMFQERSQPGQESGNGGPGKKIGTENVTVPAGNFECEHYRKQENGKTIDYWVSTKVSPYGVVKMTSPDTSMVLEKILANQTSHITGKVHEMQVPHF